MSFSVNTNSGAMAALRTLNQTQSMLSKTQSHIESGLKVGSAKDDPSTFVIAQGMRGDIGSLKAVKEGLNFGKASINMASAAAKSVSDTLVKLQEKATQAGNPSLDVDTLQVEAEQLINQISSIVGSAELGGINLLDGSGIDMNVLSGISSGGNTTSIQIDGENATVGAGGLAIDNIDLRATTVPMTIGSNIAIAAGDTVSLTYATEAGTHQVVFEFQTAGTALTSTTDMSNPAATREAVKVEVNPPPGAGTQSTLEMMDVLKSVMAEKGFTMEIDGAQVNITHANRLTAAAATSVGLTAGAPVAGNALAAINTAKDRIGDIMSRLGAASNRLDAQQEFTQVLIDTFEEGVGVLVDANLAEESAKLQALQTKEQLGVQSLSIANQRPQSIMSLFRG